MEVKKSGIITIVGRPNVGKSTLLNALVGEKIAIVTNKPQTTRNRICGIVTRGDCQFVFTDTPGLHKARNRLGEYMDGVVRASITDVDAAVLVVEPIPKPGTPELQLMERMKALKVPGVLVINKIDTLEQKDKLLEVIDAYQQEFDFDAILPISAQKGDGVPRADGHPHRLPDRRPSAVSGGHDHRPAGAAGDGGNFAGKDAPPASAGDPPRDGGGDHPVLRAGQ